MRPEKAMEKVGKFINKKIEYASIDHPMDENWTWCGVNDRGDSELLGHSYIMFKNRDWKAYVDFPIVPYPTYSIEVKGGDNYKFHFKVNHKFDIVNYKILEIDSDE